MDRPIVTDAQIATHERDHEGLSSALLCPLCADAAAAERDYAASMDRVHALLGTAFPPGPGDVSRIRS